MRRTETEAIGVELERMRALLRAAQERGEGLRPVWASYLLCETLRSLKDALDRLESELAVTGRS